MGSSFLKKVSNLGNTLKNSTLSIRIKNDIKGKNENSNDEVIDLNLVRRTTEELIDSRCSAYTYIL